MLWITLNANIAEINLLATMLLLNYSEYDGHIHSGVGSRLCDSMATWKVTLNTGQHNRDTILHF